MNLKYHTPSVHAVFFDRDDTLIQDFGYIADPKQVKLLPDAGEVIRHCWQARVWCFVVSNQSGIARQLLTRDDLYRVHQRLDELLWKKYRVGIHRYLICPHHPDEHCVCRKPSPYLLTQAAHLYGLSLSHCWMVGDKESDIEAGNQAGMRTFRVGTPDRRATAWGEDLLSWWAQL